MGQVNSIYQKDSGGYIIFLNGSLFHNCEQIQALLLEDFVIVMDGILYQMDLCSSSLNFCAPKLLYRQKLVICCLIHSHS